MNFESINSRFTNSKQLRIPSHVRVLHVEQEVAGDETSALESVLECDQERSAMLRREAELQALISRETELQALAEKEGGTVGERETTTTTDNVDEELNRLYEAMQLAEVDKAPAKASAILSGLGFSVERQAWPTKSFSGGWRMRLALARALFSRPDLLLLDEPTNMLDIKAILWLEKYLQSWPTTLLVVSHDRNFLDTVSLTKLNFLNLFPVSSLRRYYIWDFTHYRYRPISFTSRDKRSKRIEAIMNSLKKPRANARGISNGSGKPSKLRELTSKSLSIVFVTMLIALRAFRARLKCWKNCEYLCSFLLVVLFILVKRICDWNV